MKRTLILVLVALTLAACVKLGGEPVDKRFYRINPVRSGETATGHGDAVLKVRRMTVSDFYQTRELVYQMEDGRIESDFYNMFFVAPSSMLTAELRDWLDASGLFGHIVKPGSMVVPTYTLEGVVNSLYGDYTDEEPAAVVSMQFFVVNESTADNEIVFSRDYQERVSIAQHDPQQLVMGMTQAVERIFTQLEQDLAASGLAD